MMVTSKTAVESQSGKPNRLSLVEGCYNPFTRGQFPPPLNQTQVIFC